MRILYYDWHEFTDKDCLAEMERLGYYVDILSYEWNKTATDAGFEAATAAFLSRRDIDGSSFYDAVMSWNYFPSLSNAAQKFDTPYISWVFDSPHMPLCSHTVNNPVNRIYMFDRGLAEEMQEQGVMTVQYLPLAVNQRRMEALCTELDQNISGQHVPVETPLQSASPSGKGEYLTASSPSTGTLHIYEHDVCFLGSLYDNEFSFYDYIEMPDDLRAALDMIFKAQMSIYGQDIIGDKRVLPDQIIEELGQYLRFDITDNYEMDHDTLIRDVLRKKITQLERKDLLTTLGSRFKVDLYTREDSILLPNVYDLGPAEYYNEMPRIFHRSKINLNIMLRTIKTGMSLRILDIMGAGGFLLSTWQPELEEYFEDGVDLAMARTPEELIDKCAYYLAHDDIRERIARNGQQKVFDLFSYEKMLPRLLDNL